VSVQTKKTRTFYSIPFGHNMDQAKAIVSLYDAGMTVPDISQKLGMASSTIYYQLHRYLKTGSYSRVKGQGRKRTARTPDNVTKIKAKFKKDPFKSMRQVARELQINKKQVRQVVKVDMKAKSRARVKKHLVTQVSKEKWLEKSQNLLNIIRKKMPAILFSDKKVFDVDSVSNSRLDRYVSLDKTEEVPDNVKYKFETKHPASTMMFGLISSDGKKMPPVFFPPGTKEYIQVLQSHVLPWIRKNYGLEGDYVLQQDGAPCTTSKRTQAWLKDQGVKFWPKEIWPPNSPDLNPLDYSVWAVVARKACQKPHSNIASLQASIRSAWRAMSPSYIRLTCSRFRPQLEAVVANDGGHIEA
jgi:transposase